MSATLAILGLLIEQPRHGYALDRVIDERGMRRWTSIGFSSIYWIIDQLVAEGLVEAREELNNGRRRRVLLPTEAGRRRWREECLSALATLERSDESFLISLSGLPGLPVNAVRASLTGRLQALTETIDEVDRAEESAGPSAPTHVSAMFAYSRSVLTAQRDWLMEFLRDWR